jgi:hypothetical protein
MVIKNILFALMIGVGITATSFAQTYFTKNGQITFFSKTILENINADNNQVISIINFETGSMQFSLLNNAFHFPKAKMEEDFNQDYMESDQYPRSTFKGMIDNIPQIDFTKDGTIPVKVSGELMIHGVKKNITVPGNLIIKNGQLSATAHFKLFIKDYNIKIPSIVSNKISESIDVTVNCLYQKK